MRLPIDRLLVFLLYIRVYLSDKWIQMIISTIFTDMDMNTICMTLVAKTVFTYNIVFPRGSWFSTLMLIKWPFVRSANLNSQMFWHLMRKLRSNCCAAELSQIASSFIVWRFFSGMIPLRELHLHVDYIHYLFFCTTWVAHDGTCFPWCYLYGTSCLVPVGWIVSPEIQGILRLGIFSCCWTWSATVILHWKHRYGYGSSWFKLPSLDSRWCHTNMNLHIIFCSLSIRLPDMCYIYMRVCVYVHDYRPFIYTI